MIEVTLSFLYYVPLTQYVARFPSERRVKAGGSYVAADVPERLDSWRRFYGVNDRGEDARGEGQA